MLNLTWRDMRNICLVWAFLLSGWAVVAIVAR